MVVDDVDKSWKRALLSCNNQGDLVGPDNSVDGDVSKEEDEDSSRDESWPEKDSCWGENLLVEGDEDDVDEVENIHRQEVRSPLTLFGDTGNKRVSGISVPFSCPEYRA
ncbi:hypothetical protein TanjilG_08539 [Lupinus angustifolius]|uniref:Uncharacterized protein n=1 Tax=Lupinus angustifolius TaxID=3871 RepID=A0A1J7GIS1_LUPAN|nr:hypothetical protein TanjilG_08539 [Lupinus angustifolius]